MDADIRVSLLNGGYRMVKVAVEGLIVDFSDVDLSCVDFRNFCFVGADLSRSNLSEADLSGSTLRKACLCGANLYRTNFCGADIYKADFEGANIDETIFYDNVVLSIAYCLEEERNRIVFKSM